MDHNQLVDIYFTITAAAIILLTILIGAALLYIISIFRTIRRIVRSAEFAAGVISEDLQDLRQNIKSRGLSITAFAKFFKDLGKRRIFPKK